MRTYTALLKFDAEPVLVREGFAWGALIFGPFWLIAHQAWIAGAISLAACILIAAVAPEPVGGVLQAGVAMILGLTGNDLRRWALEHRGYLVVHVLAASGIDEAWLRLLTYRPDLAARLRPDPA
jgi:hypothetical protein